MIAAIRYSIERIDKNKPIEESQINLMVDKWFGIFEFINPILRFASSFTDYLTPYSYYILVSSIEFGDDSVRGMVGFIERIIFSLDESYPDKEKLLEVERKVKLIQTILQRDSLFYQLIMNRVSSLNNIINGIFTDLNEAKVEFSVTGEDVLKNEYTVNIPKLYAEHLIRRELVTNFKNHALKDGKSKISIDISKNSENAIILNLLNKSGVKDVNKSNLEGIKCLKLMANSPLFGFDYSNSISKNIFTQVLIFKPN